MHSECGSSSTHAPAAQQHAPAAFARPRTPATRCGSLWAANPGRASLGCPCTAPRLASQRCVFCTALQLWPPPTPRLGCTRPMSLPSPREGGRIARRGAAELVPVQT